MSSYYSKVINENRMFIIRLLRGQFDFIFHELREISKYKMCYTPDKEKRTISISHPIHLSSALQKYVHNIPESLALPNATLVIDKLSNAVSCVLALYDEALQIVINFYKRGLATGETDNVPLFQI